MTGQRRSLEEALAACGGPAVDRLAPALAAAGFAGSLPERLRLVALKAEGWLELWGLAGTWRPIRRYPVLAASGTAGPKLKEGDRQVPEGRYALTLLNPASAYHLSIRIGYPSAEDEAQAVAEGRGDLGGDIMIHGGARSVGCLAVGDPAIEELFVLVAAVGLERSEILIAPCDLRHQAAGDPRPWVAARYAALGAELADLPSVSWPEGEKQ